MPCRPMKSFGHPFHPMPAVGIWSRAGVVLPGLMLAVVGLWGCGGSVRIIQESPESGVALYVYKGKGGHLRSSSRPEAHARIREFCHGPYRVIKEGNTKGRQRVIESMDGFEEVVTEHWWGIRFHCEANGKNANRAGQTLHDH